MFILFASQIKPEEYLSGETSLGDAFFESIFSLVPGNPPLDGAARWLKSNLLRRIFGDLSESHLPQFPEMQRMSTGTTFAVVNLVANRDMITALSALEGHREEIIAQLETAFKVALMVAALFPAITEVLIVEDQLLPNFGVDSIDVPCSLLDDIRNIFEWDEVAVEYLPWWLTASGRQNREDLRQRLLRLPGDVQTQVVLKDWLIASMARVYLPIKPGHEKDVLWWAQLNDEARHYMEQCLNDFTQWRQNQFGPIPYALPTYEEVLAIKPATATPAGSDQWLNDWERPRQKFMVLDEWAELLPTDGVHIEPALSEDGSADAYRTTSLLNDLETAAAQNRLQDAKSQATSAAVLRDNLSTKLKIKE